MKAPRVNGCGAESVKISCSDGIREPTEGARLTGLEEAMAVESQLGRSSRRGGSGESSLGEGLGVRYEGAWLRILDLVMTPAVGDRPESGEQETTRIELMPAHEGIGRPWI